MSIFNAPFEYGYNTFDEVFQSESGQQVGWARLSVDVTGTAGLYQIGTLVILGADRETATIPATVADLKSATAGSIAILARKDIKNSVFPAGATHEEVAHNFNPDVLHLTATALTKEHVVIADARNGGAIGDAQIGFPADATPADKKEIFTKLKVENGFKVLKQAVKG